jgi:hypothetical protein
MCHSDAAEVSDDETLWSPLGLPSGKLPSAFASTAQKYLLGA